MRMTISTEFDCPINTIWSQLHKPALLVHIAEPIIHFVPRDPATLPPRWQAGRYRVGMWAFGLVPMGSQWVGIEYPEGPDISAGRAVLRDNGSGRLVPIWDHWIFLEDIGAGRTRYTDRVDVEAGVLTPMIWLFACLFYAHRQRRWHRLIRANFAPLEDRA